MENELYHYGVLGMKWGVRRYRNFDGSYTRAGLKRYDKSMSDYEKANTRYKDAKKNKASKTEITNARMQRKNAKRQLDKDYKHLKQDKLGDKGKELYSKGQTITGNSMATYYLNRIGGLTIAAAGYNARTGTLGSDKVTKYLGAAGVGALSISAAKSMYDANQAKKLRAYYSHTSNY